MYTPNHFKSPNRESELQLIADFPLATLVLNSPNGLDANLIPLYWFADESDGGRFGVLRGHVARANPLWQQAGAEVLAIFQSPSHYISPGYYPSKARDPRVVPTWNYSTVQVRGELKVLESSEALLSLLTKVTTHHEQGSASPWQLSDAPAPYLDKMLAAIVGIEIKISSSISGKFKQSQNQSAENQAGVREALAANLGR
ncbi:FMN-binding negative transcriptional regulator [Chitinibacter bivalviorum]|uniref:FMN-binding negative transcriptional regulator n=1 Tax=Chitinibacter bivalviorum TaxID=2739434 RepID=A0A7H9BLF0_9NEIS|nr:FMN-binding negative transcriptional regulator [Chitinibacter bivalviorum]QLG89413.1 FMN-binding negative transcriptional regulator [Chitinibacter bivalviorum]